jgi:hypothetical protein
VLGLQKTNPRLERQCPLLRLEIVRHEKSTTLGNDDMTPKRPQLAKSIIDIATGEKPDRDPTPEEQGEDPGAVRRTETASTAAL